MSNTLAFQVDGIQHNIDRAADIRNAPTPTATVRQRLAETAQSLSLAGVMRAHLDVAIEAMAALVTVLYATDADGQPANFDKRTGRILIPMPWGSGGWRRWGLRKWEAHVLRGLLMERAKVRRRLAPLFDYSDDNNRWYLNVSDYPTAEAALGWLRKEGPKLEEWRTAVNNYRLADAERRRKASGG